jgi:hypothetical protein
MHSTNYMTVDVEPIFFKMLEDLQILQNRNTRDNYSNQKWFFQSLLKTPFKQVNMSKKLIEISSYVFCSSFD